MSATEPAPAAFGKALACYAAATRPALPGSTFVGCLPGPASAQADGAATALLTPCVTVLFALAARAGANVLSDDYDALNGSDAANADRRCPSTGGSRFIQNGVLGEHESAVLGYALLAAGCVLGCISARDAISLE